MNYYMQSYMAIVTNHFIFQIVSQQDSKLVANLMYITWWITSNIFSIFLYCFVAEQIRTQVNLTFTAHSFASSLYSESIIITLLPRYYTPSVI